LENRIAEAIKPSYKLRFQLAARRTPASRGMLLSAQPAWRQSKFVLLSRLSIKTDQTIDLMQAR
jgi:hypothetical protein